MHRMALAFSFALFAVAADPYAADVAAARADHASYGPSARYLWFGAIPDEPQQDAGVAMRFWLPHLSRVTPLEYQRPTLITPTLARIDLEQLGWGYETWRKLCDQYPLATFPLGTDLLMVRADWLCWVTADATRSTAYYDLLYAGIGTPKTKADFFKVWQVDQKGGEPYQLGVVIDEGKSGVAFRSRLAVYTPSPGGALWETFDSREGFGTADPLENLTGPDKLAHDAQEMIAAIPKFDLATGERGLCQAYLLVDGKGNRVDEAPTDIVEDKSKFLGEPAIRTPGSCVQCHSGLNGPQENSVREWIADGIELSTYQREAKEYLERFYLSKEGKLITRQNEDFDQFCLSATGLDAVDCVSAYRALVTGYDASVNLEQAAREVYARDGQELRLAIAWYSERLGPAPGVGRLASLTRPNGKVPRRVWQGDRTKGQTGVWHQAMQALSQWRTK